MMERAFSDTHELSGGTTKPRLPGDALQGGSRGIPGRPYPALDQRAPDSG
jgi:hypothetical protein